MPGRASHRFNLATLLTFAGDLDGAEREYGECLRLDPTQWKAHLALSQLRRQTASANHVESLRTLLSTAGGNAEARLYLNLALAKEYEDLGQIGRAHVELQSLMRISYAVFCLKKKINQRHTKHMKTNNK